jgi:heme a synthase
VTRRAGRLPGWPSNPARHVVQRLALASLVANLAIVVTGGAVRLTSSGLGCPEWPRCSAGSFVVQRALGVHGAIEFGNRMLTIVLALVAVATFTVVWQYRPTRRSWRLLAGLLLLGIPAQALLGGITVRTHLNPWVVALHLLLSMALIGVAVALVLSVRRDGQARLPAVASAPALLVRLTFVVAWLVLYAGTVVTGSGPHAGDLAAPRTGLDPAVVSQLHADLVFLLIGLTAGSLFALRAAGASQAARAAAVLVAVELAQGVVGFVQYFTGLPELLVGLHLLGAGAVSACATWLLLSVPRESAVRIPAPVDVLAQVRRERE